MGCSKVTAGGGAPGQQDKGKGFPEMSIDDDESDTHDTHDAFSRTRWPQTVDEAVARILAGMPEADQQMIRATPKDDLIMFHHGWGTGIRNAFGLWGGNTALMKSCAEAQGYGADPAFMHPDDASGVIIEAVWRRLQDEK